MKKLFLFVLSIFSAAMLFAQVDTSVTHPPKKDSVNASDSADMAKIYVIRSTGYVGSAVNLRVLVDDINFCKIKNNKYSTFYIKPGTHLFNATSWDKPGSDPKFALKLPVEAGKSYYMSMKIKQKFFGIEITLEEITYNTAAPMLEKYKRDECD